MGILHKVGVLLVLLATGSMSRAQNFIPNGSFENYAACPQARNDGRVSYSWDTPTQGTSDYFNSCASNQSQLSVPANFAGTQAARTGRAYAGFYISQNFHDPFYEYREYMQVTLDSFLVAGGVYTFEMYVSLGDNSNYASNKIGAYISADKISANTDQYLAYTPQIISSGYITDKTGWTKITGVYIAKGGEHYITIGSFEPAASNTRQAVSGGSSNMAFNGVSYYYLDDVSMTRSCDLPNALLGSDISECDQQYSPVTIEPLLTTPAAFLWNNGKTTKTITADTPGTYILKATTPYCSVYDTIRVSFTKKPSVSLGKDTTLCSPMIKLSATTVGATAYRWSNGSTDSSINAIATGTYWVKVSEGSCYSSDTIKVNIVTMQPFNLGPDTTICSGRSITLGIDNNPLANYRWSTGQTSRQLVISSAGVYKAEAYLGNCSVKDSITVSMEQTPQVSLGNDTALCFNTPFRIDASSSVSSYLWNDGGNRAYDIVSGAGTYWVQVKGNYCSNRDTIVLTQQVIPVVNLGSDRKVCSGSQVLLNAGNAGSTYAWSNGSSTQSNTVTAPGTFYVKVTNSKGCYAGDTLVLDTFALPAVSLGRDSTMCEGSTYVLNPGSFATYLWQDKASSKRTYTVHSQGTYSVTVTDNNGCSNADTVTILYNGRPSVSLTRELYLCEPDTLLTAESSASVFAWNNGSAGPSLRITDYGIFSVTVTDSNACTNTAQVEVKSTCHGTLYVPNAFTPANDDGLNQTFFPVTRNTSSVNLQIYNRWGELLYETSDPKQGWDGTFSHQPVPADVYVYKIKYVGLNGAAGMLSGNVTLLK